ncbi:hypothetical protein [Phyllobacterium zundukense]|uniref:hypothetical protein n=1 Tax=Phyllobacterium zundukense TaxID=1867719 RepID=UPI001055C838|nr:hypothetical protein [Phyllobacterium zundukense]
MINEVNTRISSVTKKCKPAEGGVAHIKNLARGVLTATLVVAVSSCAAMPTKMAQGQARSTEFGYSSPLKETTTRKAIKNVRVISETVVKARYLGRAPYICTPSGFGRTSSCFAR